tara:strand:+ start:5163 stop:5615 length:453 start_codon:yes stop_codon:yes gene_type:complete
MTEDSQNGIHDHKARVKQLNSNLYRVETVHGVKQDVVFNSYPENMTVEEPKDLYTLSNKVIGWHYDRNLIGGSTDKDQVLKLAQELGELSDSVCKGKDVKDDIGDMLVVLINIAERNGVVLAECLDKAWNDIKDRKGRMIDGIFVKETDL